VTEPGRLAGAPSPPARWSERVRRVRAEHLLLGALVLLWAWIAWPWIDGQRLLILRDVLTTHRHFKFFGAEQLVHGRIPAINPTWGLGQPFRGNPNTVPFYPDNLLYLWLPFHAAFHLHFALHWLLALFGARKLGRELGQSAEGALMTGLAWAGSGFLLSMLSFYNLLGVCAWAPWVLWGVACGGRRGVALGGVACGLMLLAGEPLSAALVTIPMAMIAVERHGVVAGLKRALGIGGLGLLLAAPQIVATARILPFSFRAAHGLDAQEAGGFGFSPFRLLELVLPLPWGWPSDLERFGFWSTRVTPDIPYVYSIYPGLVATALALAGARRRLRWALLAAATLLAAWAGGLLPGAISALTGGLFRYPQKLLLLFALAAALLAGWGLDACRGSAKTGRVLAAAAAGLLACGVGLRLVRPAFIEFLRTHFAAPGARGIVPTPAGVWIVALVAGGLLLGGAAWAIARGRALWVVVAEIACLLQLAPMLVTDSTDHYREPPPYARLMGEPRSVVPVPSLLPDWERRLPYPPWVSNPPGQTRVTWFQVEPPFGVPLGFSYPLAPDLEGMTTPLHVYLYRNLQLASWNERVPWLARLGVGWVIRFGTEAIPGLEQVSSEEQFGVPTELLRVPDPAPLVAWPERLAVAPNPLSAFVAVAHGRIAPGTAIASRPVAFHPGGVVRLVEHEPDRWVVDVDSQGGLVVIQTAWHPIWKARLEDGTPLATQPTDVVLTGVEVPAGEHRVTLEISSWPETLAGVLAALVAAAALIVAARSRE
jgi:hypothetical protein